MHDFRIVDYRHRGTALRGLAVAPPGDGPHPAVLVMSDAMGLGPQGRRRARMLAENGYVALCGDMYGEGVHLETPEDVGRHIAPLHDDPVLLRERALAGLAALRTLPGVDGDRVGAIGYCFGGQCVLEIARSGAALKSAVSLHGLLTTRLPAGPGDIRARILVITGARDPYAPEADVDGLRREMSAAEADWHLTIYSEGYHAFTDPGATGRSTVPGLRYDPLLDRVSWASTLAMLDATLK